jgi:outer membrane protein TolC
VAASFTGARDRPASEGRRVADVSTQISTALLTQAVPTGGTVILSSDLGRTEKDAAHPPRQYDTAYAVSVVQPLLRGGRVYVATRPIRDAEFDVRVQEAQLQAEILGVTAQTKAAYYNALLVEKIIGVTQDAIARDEDLIEASQALFKAGLVTKRDVYSAEISRADDLVKLARARGELESARNALRDVLGIPIGSDIALRDRNIAFEPVTLALDAWIAMGFQRRPEILGLNETLKKSALNIRVAQNTLLPQVDAIGSYGRAETASTFQKSNSLRGDMWTAGVLFSYPLGNVAARSELARARIEHSRFERELVQQKRLVELQVRAAVIKLDTSLDKMKPLATGVEQAEGKLEIAKARFALGVTTNLDVTDAQEKLLDAETDLLRAVVDYDIGLAELEASIAGPI